VVSNGTASVAVDSGATWVPPPFVGGVSSGGPRTAGDFMVSGCSVATCSIPPMTVTTIATGIVSGGMHTLSLQAWKVSLPASECVPLRASIAARSGSFRVAVPL
jgi:hypothetical protein